MCQELDWKYELEKRELIQITTAIGPKIEKRTQLIQAIIKQELGLSSDTNSLSKAGISLTGLDKFNLPGAKQQLRNMFDKLKKCKCQQQGPNQPVN